METIDPVVDYLQQLTWIAMAISLSDRQGSGLVSSWLSRIALAKLTVLSPPNELLTEFTTSPHVAVKGFSLCSFV